MYGIITRDDWPKTATLKAIDYWCGVCYLIVFAVLVEYCTILYLTKPDFWIKKGLNRVETRSKRSNKKYTKLAAKIEKGARLLFPATLLIFILLFVISVSV